jgi:hypothetical protein
MAKSLGKHPVLCETILNGVPQGNLRVENRVVYEKPDGTYEVNFLDGRRAVVKKPNGSFYWGLVVRSIRPSTLADILGLK